SSLATRFIESSNAPLGARHRGWSLLKLIAILIKQRSILCAQWRIYLLCSRLLHFSTRGPVRLGASRRLRLAHSQNTFFATPVSRPIKGAIKAAMSRADWHSPD